MNSSSARQSRPAKLKGPAKIGRGSSEAPEDLDPMADLDISKDSLGYAVKLAQVRTYEMLYQALGPNAISPARMTALSLVATNAGISQAALADRLRIARPSVVKVVDSLESAGLIERQPGADRRSHALALTARGRAELVDIRRRLRGYEDAISAHLSAAERRQLLGLLERVAVA